MVEEEMVVVAEALEDQAVEVTVAGHLEQIMLQVVLLILEAAAAV